ncbi:uncharacterized protein LOC126856687 isoform X2 [Cataglyphis hispanica]|uniref:uncharacterized protein LOC126856687 isoform X2 n=1 Tax=Cataglyphis hispanica TaxID=1086592 RepID=UPI00217F4F91|nr:uncharacterized protein LOC126856687 isoform X2 [Cataglyphis hispanica]
MFWVFLGLLGSAIAAQSSYDLETRAVSFPGKPSLGPLYSSSLNSAQGFRDNSYEDNAVTPTPSPTPIYRSQQPLYRKPTATPIDARDYPQSTAIRIGSPSRAPARGQYGPNNGPTQEELEEEKEEPDRLSLLLPQSRFDCVNKQTGYYADEDLNCEVFHYCQDNAKHSWICPEGFTFHQVHLICMPPSGDISCKKSSQYHFVNEYLYKPLNLQEAENKPNVTLRYSERYYPADIYTDEREVGDYQITPTVAPTRRPAPQSTGAPQFRLPVNQVFHSPEEVNIPLQHRRPQQQQQHHVLRRYPQIQSDAEDYE